MPMPTKFQSRLISVLPALVAEFGIPFHIYDEQGILDQGQTLRDALKWVDFQEHFAVKALPNLRILGVLLNQLGFGFDCSSVPELEMVRELGAKPADIMFTANNTTKVEFDKALGQGGCILNLDDIRFVARDRVRRMPSLVSFRYNPGERRITSNEIIGNPREAKYGVPHHDIVAAFKLAQDRGAVQFGIHTMIVSNELDHRFMVETVRMLLEVVEEVSQEVGIERFEFINIGGGLGIPYTPYQQPFDLAAFSGGAEELFKGFRERNGYVPKLLLESGRWMTGPHGVLVTTCTNNMSKYIEVRGLDAAMPDLMRPGMYGSEEEGSQHQITVMTVDGQIKAGPLEMQKVVGSLCEGNDVFAYRPLPPIDEGDLVIIHDTGAHGHSMGFQYNGRLRHAEWLLRTDGMVEQIRLDETTKDYLRTQRNLKRVFDPTA